MSADLLSVAIVEDNAGLRRSLETMISRGAGTVCTGTYATGEDALREIPTLQPHVVLMDVNLPGMNGAECVGLLSVVLPSTQFLMLTVYDDSDAIFNSLASGAAGYLLKPLRAAQLIAAIKEVRSGGSPMTANIARRVVQAFKKPALSANETVGLSPREREILDLLVVGLLQKEIAERLGISYWTVQTHISRIYEKLHVRSRAQAVAKYLGV